MAARAARLLGEPAVSRGTPAPPVRLADRRVRPLRMVGARGSAARPAGRARFSAPVRGRRRAPPYAFARRSQSEGRVLDRGHSRAPWHPGDGRRLGPLARAPPAGPGRPASESYLAAGVHARGGGPRVLPGKLTWATCA